ncbi:MAG: hypothetical protein JW900_06870 [Anaerolineae bacterium]|nr:hypothetical protein [Anaerolineae bacterium]
MEGIQTRIKIGLMKLADPRLARWLLFGLIAILGWLSHSGLTHVDPCMGEGSCNGG